MAEIEFLSAGGTPLAKTITLTPDNQYEIDPYPFVKKFTSHRCTYSTTAELYALLKHHGGLQNCVVNGLLKRPIVNESRAGMTSAAAATQRLVLDLDFFKGWDSPREFLADLNPDWAEVSFVFQRSASSATSSKPTLRGHIWLNLAIPAQPTVLKHWLTERNLNNPGLNDLLRLTATGTGLRYPLDITTCQNDKLIYIAPPVCRGFDDPVKERFVLYEGAYDVASAPFMHTSADIIETAKRTAVNRIRKEKGLPRKTLKTKKYLGVRIQSNPDAVPITGIKHARGYVYFNINGGDSWGYYVDESSPEIVRNFKGEPPTRLKDLAPDIYEDLQSAASKSEIAPIVFREFSTDTYYNLMYNRGAQQIISIAKTSSKDKLSDFCALHSRPCPDPIPDWRAEFDPTTTKVLDETTQWINKFAPSVFAQAHGAGLLPHETEMPPVAAKIISSICGSSPAVVNHFINWLAVIFQTRRRTNTAWIFSGVHGTGKGVMLDYVLRPLIGPEQTRAWTTQQMDEPYNAPLECASLLWLDEFQAGTNSKGDMLVNKLRSYITEPQIGIRDMRATTRMCHNYMNVIIATNRSDIIQIEPTDRRFNVAPAQTNVLRITGEELEQLRNEEIVKVAGYLSHYQASLTSARTILKTAARKRLIAMTETTTSRMFRALIEGDLAWFLGFMPQDLSNTAVHGDIMATAAYDRLIKDWVRSTVALTANQKLSSSYTMSVEDMHVLYSFLSGARIARAKFMKMLECNRVPISPGTKFGSPVTGVKVKTRRAKQVVKDFRKSLDTGAPTLKEVAP